MINKATNWLMGFGTNRILMRVNAILAKAQTGGSLRDIKKDIRITLVIAEALKEASTIAVNLLTQTNDILADNKITEDEATIMRVAATEAAANFKGLLKK